MRFCVLAPGVPDTFASTIFHLAQSKMKSRRASLSPLHIKPCCIKLDIQESWIKLWSARADHCFIFNTSHSRYDKSEVKTINGIVFRYLNY